MNATKTTAAPVENAPVLYTPENIMAIMHISRSSVYKLFSSEGFPCLLWLHSNLSPKTLCSICLPVLGVCRVSSMLIFLSNILQIPIHSTLAVC